MISVLFDENAEKAVLSSIFYTGSKIYEALLYLRPDDFYTKTHKLIFSSMISLWNKNEHIDPVTVYDEVLVLSSRDKTFQSNHAFSLPEYIDSIVSFSGTDRTLELYAKIIKKYSIKRTVLSISKELTDMALNTDVSPEELIESSQTKTFLLSLDYKSKNLQHAKVFFSDIEIELKNSSRKELGIQSGFSSLDTITGGFKNSDFIIIGARPSVGKTAFALNIATHIALREHKGVLFFSLEMTGRSLSRRILQSEGCIDGYRVQKNMLTPEETRFFSELKNKINDSSFYIDDTDRISLTTLKAEARKLKRTEDISIIFIDYISLISLESRYLPRHEQVAFISASLKELARELSIPIVALSQLTRDTEGREPTLASLRESGALEQDADLVILLHRDKKNSEAEKDKDIVKVTVAKHRNGRVGDVSMEFISKYTKFIS